MAPSLACGQHDRCASPKQVSGLSRRPKTDVNKNVQFVPSDRDFTLVADTLSTDSLYVILGGRVTLEQRRMFVAPQADVHLTQKRADVFTLRSGLR